MGFLLQCIAPEYTVEAVASTRHGDGVEESRGARKKCHRVNAAS